MCPTLLEFILPFFTLALSLAVYSPPPNSETKIQRNKEMENVTVISGDKPTVMVTNDDGIEGPGLLALVQVLVSSHRYNVLVCAPDSYVKEKN